MHFLVLGATGPSGLTFLSTALSSGHHDLTIYARNTSKLPQHLHNLSLSSSASPRVHIIQGEFSSSDASKFTLALKTGANVLVSFAGPSIPSRAGTPVTEFLSQVVFQGIVRGREEGWCAVERVLVLSTPSFKVEGDAWSWKWWGVVWGVWALFGDAYGEVVGVGRVTSRDLAKIDQNGEERAKGLEWTVFRVPLLWHGRDAGPVRAGPIGKKGDGLLLNRKSMAVWLLQEAEERKWVGKCPAISDAGGWI